MTNTLIPAFKHLYAKKLNASFQEDHQYIFASDRC